jgi:hypothetical protein
MALSIPKEADYFILPNNVIPGVPKAAYLAHATNFPQIGHLVRRETAQDSEWDLATTDENFSGMIVAVNANRSVLSIAELLPGTTIILPTTGAVALGDKVEANATPLAAVGSMGISRGQVVVDNVNGVGAVVDLLSGGAATATVRF